MLSDAALDGSPSAPVLDDEQLAKVAAIAEHIIPETDTPGAIAAGVPEFIHRIVAEWYTPDERRTFLQGLADVELEAHSQFGTRFDRLGQGPQTSVLRALEAQRSSGSASVEYGPFFAQIKELTVLGYYTSEVASRSELAYRPVPGAYDGHAHVAANDRQRDLVNR